ncbi:hypothetical protein CUN61_02885 [Pseudomonas arsenicoxydans]|uniref:Uncharacterized protein n=1 Tax=Pseudomonas arsenicoxydans TaxID=702115 RepID=A0A4P6FVR4_9PSED|nr:hypothetical protein CUN61_02885 [Pseudomonas arsenicoxydans]
MASGTRGDLCERAVRKAERKPCGSGLAREEAHKVGIFIDCQDAFAGKPAPTGLRADDQHLGREPSRRSVEATACVIGDVW